MAMKTLLWIAILLGAQWAIGQECTRVIPVNVLDLKTHHPVQAIEADRLHGSLGNNPVVISKMEKIKGNRILLLVDVSGSQEQERAFLRAQIGVLLAATPPGSPLAYSFFSARPITISTFAADASEIAIAAEKLQTIKMDRATALFDALHEGLKIFQPPLPGDSILVLTDSLENSSKTRRNDLAKELRASGVRLFSILQTRYGRLVDESSEAGELNRLVEETGGGMYTFPPSGFAWYDLKTRMELQAFWLEGVGSGYLLTVGVPKDLDKNEHLKIRLDKGSDAALKNATVLYPHYLPSCETASAAAR